MIKEVLYNKKDRALLKKELKAETFKRITCSFYRYTGISDVQSFRDRLYRDLSKINVFGRVYVAAEGVNAQISCPDHQWGAFRKKLNSYEKDYLLKYNILVYSKISPYLNKKEKKWLASFI